MSEANTTAIYVEDANPVSLSCSIENDTVSLWHEGELLARRPAEIEVELELELKLSDASIKIDDFQHDGTLHTMHAHTIEASGTLAPWSRTVDSVESPSFTLPFGEDEMIYHAVLMPATPDGEQPDSWHTNVIIRVKPKGGKPGG